MLNYLCRYNGWYLGIHRRVFGAGLVVVMSDVHSWETMPDEWNRIKAWA